MCRGATLLLFIKIKIKILENYLHLLFTFIINISDVIIFVALDFEVEYT